MDMPCEFEDQNLSIIRDRLKETGSTLRFDGLDVSSEVLKIVANYLPEVRDNYVVKSTMIGTYYLMYGYAGRIQEIDIISTNLKLRFKWDCTTNSLMEIQLTSGKYCTYFYSEIANEVVAYVGISVPVYRKPSRPICIPMRFTQRSFQYMKDPRVLNMMLKLKPQSFSTYDIPFTTENGVSLEELNICGKSFRSVFYRYEIGKFDAERCWINEATYCKRAYPELIIIEYSNSAGEKYNNLCYIFDAKMKLKEIRYSAWKDGGPYGYKIYVKGENNIVVERLNRDVDKEQLEFAMEHRVLPYKCEYV